jgi:uncharacterized membrane protein (DUF2068 family)
MPPAGSSPQPANRALRWIGTLQLAKGVLLLALALGLLSFLHRDVDEIVGVWMRKAGFNIEKGHAAAFLEMLDLVTDKQLFQMSLVAFAFAGVLVTQGTGLFLRKEWAKYLTLVATALLIPFEAFELAKGFGYVKLTVLLVNVAIVALMIYLVRAKRVAARSANAGAVEPPAVFAGDRRLPET